MYSWPLPGNSHRWNGCRDLNWSQKTQLLHVFVSKEPESCKMRNFPLPSNMSAKKSISPSHVILAINCRFELLRRLLVISSSPFGSVMALAPALNHLLSSNFEELRLRRSAAAVHRLSGRETPGRFWVWGTKNLRTRLRGWAILCSNSSFLFLFDLFRGQFFCASFGIVWTSLLWVDGRHSDHMCLRP